MPKKPALKRTRSASGSIQKLLYPTLAFSFLLNLFLLAKPYLLQLTANNQELTSGKVKRIVDGDTFDLTNDKRIRLAGADTPEYPKGCLSHEAKDRLEQLILDKTVQIEEVDKDNFGRQIAYVFLDDVMIDKILVQEGLAQAMNNNPLYDPQILSLEDQAKKIKKGIWSTKCQPKKPDKNCKIKGNFRRDRNTKIYHTPDCYNYDKIVINESQQDRWFCTEQEAENAGFVKSKDCP